MATAKTTLGNINDSLEQFDLNSPLTEEELRVAGMLTVLPSMRRDSIEATPVLQDIEDPGDDTSVDVVASFVNRDDYNAQYAHYMRCQALAALVAFTDGWKSFEEMVLKTYVSARRLENSGYKGDDPNKAFSLRIREQTAEDFMRFIKVMINEAITTPKPTLAAKR